MNPEIVILVPVLGRPERVAPLLENAAAATSVPYRLVFLVSQGDEEEAAAIHAAGGDLEPMPFEVGPGDYARKINLGIALSRGPWILQAADDIWFHRGWDEAALAYAGREHIGVIGTNDLGNPLTKAGRHATHSLLRRSYVEERGTIDEPGKALHEGYHHCWVDNELVETAVARNAWAAARRSHVEHMHHIWHKGEDDPTYRRGQERYARDRELFHERRPLWRGGNVRRMTA